MKTINKVADLFLYDRFTVDGDVFVLYDITATHCYWRRMVMPVGTRFEDFPTVAHTVEDMQALFDGGFVAERPNTDDVPGGAPELSPVVAEGIEAVVQNDTETVVAAPAPTESPVPDAEPGPPAPIPAAGPEVGE